ncbi:hypothetical protein [Mycobacterium sp. 1245852.3]|uniref:hypothetical protein n=1 Tax=Mycobacterium sp. 1245852.3 TaxID=1856860 RepID=UPI0007FF26A3|nr:hypothetical protein [Mycobacterium sp. 1245852.3]OBJ92997.1 hypothetical protein A9W96_21290 [Mycobacterium sp. 1245852.3]
MNIETQADIERLMIERNISLVFKPSVTEQPDGTWVALYPGAQWSVSGRDAQQARQRLHDEQLARMRDPATLDWKIEAVRRHFSEDGPVEGVYALDNDITDHVLDVGTPAALGAAVRAIEQQRRR